MNGFAGFVCFNTQIKVQLRTFTENRMDWFWCLGTFTGKWLLKSSHFFNFPITIFMIFSFYFSSSSIYASWKCPIWKIENYAQRNKWIIEFSCSNSRTLLWILCQSRRTSGNHRLVCILADSGFFKNFLYQGGVKSTVSWVFEDLKLNWDS